MMVILPGFSFQTRMTFFSIPLSIHEELLLETMIMIHGPMPLATGELTRGGPWGKWNLSECLGIRNWHFKNLELKREFQSQS